MPPAGVAGSSGTYTLFGRNLPGGLTAGVAPDGHALEKLDVQIALPSDDATLQLGGNVASFQAGNDQITYTLDTNGARSNPVPIHFAAAPATLEVEPNGTHDTAQKIRVPVEVAGQFQSPGDVDAVQFAAKAQEVFWIEVFGQRDGSGADPYLTLEQLSADESGRETHAQLIATQDDIETNLFPEHFNRAATTSASGSSLPRIAATAYRCAIATSSRGATSAWSTGCRFAVSARTFGSWWYRSHRGAERTTTQPLRGRSDYAKATTLLSMSWPFAAMASTARSPSKSQDCLRVFPATRRAWKPARCRRPWYSRPPRIHVPLMPPFECLGRLRSPLPQMREPIRRRCAKLPAQPAREPSCGRVTRSDRRSRESRESWGSAS